MLSDISNDPVGDIRREWAAELRAARRGTVAYHIERISGKIPLPPEFLAHGYAPSQFSDVSSDFARLLVAYAHARGLNRHDADYTAIYVFSTAWNWRSLMDDTSKMRVARAIGRIHLRDLQRRSRIFPSEFAFLTGWLTGVDWALPFRDLYAGAKHGVAEMAQLALLPERRIVPTLTAHVYKMAKCRWTDEAGPGDPVVAHVYEEQYRVYIRPYEDRILSSFRRFLDQIGCNAPPISAK